jgi:hypothetical protein
MYLAVFLIFLLCFVIFILVRNEQKNKKKFQEKIKFLEYIICELNQNLIKHSQKTKLIDDLNLNLNQSNRKIGTAIVDLNYEIFQQLNEKK